MSQLVGFFDSGVGGLTVLKQFFKELPDEKTVYFGDMGRAPYGARSPEIIVRVLRSRCFVSSRTTAMSNS